MNFIETDIEDCVVVEPEPRGDHRGFFARIYDSELFGARGLAERFVQFNNSLSASAGTLRGLHYQVLPHGEAKLVRCIAGAVYDVVLDLRQHSRTYGRWTGVEISAANRRLMYAPVGCAHGFLTLADNTELVYFASAAYSGASERVIRWNDPRFEIIWPRPPLVLSDKDREAPYFDAVEHASGY